jgi:hypothetical protein
MAPIGSPPRSRRSAQPASPAALASTVIVATASGVRVRGRGDRRRRSGGRRGIRVRCDPGPGVDVAAGVAGCLRGGGGRQPSRVCSELFAPQLAAAYAKAMRASCTTYFERITSFSLVVRRVLWDEDAAVVELRQTGRPRDWAVVLSRRAGGWQAVDLLPGDLVG